ncbi:MAG: hypothetical protein ACRERX_14150 [Pseudomonas sp.]
MTETESRNKDIFDALWQQVVAAHAQWQTYAALFGQDAALVQFLNKAASGFFGALQRTLLRDVYLAISRLTDPPKVGGRRNLVISQILQHPAALADPALAADLAPLLERVQSVAQPFRQHRNKKLAHLDWNTHLTSTERPLPPIVRRQVDDVLGALAAVLNSFSVRVRDQTTFFGDVIQVGDARVLIKRLEDAERWRRFRRAELKRLLSAQDYGGIAELRRLGRQDLIHDTDDLEAD